MPHKSRESIDRQQEAARELLGCRIIEPLPCTDFSNFPKYAEMDGDFYRDEVYFGKIIYRDEQMIQIECRNGNKYMDGQIFTLFIKLKETL